jgi:hypothetical protein
VADQELEVRRGLGAFGRPQLQKVDHLLGHFIGRHLLGPELAPDGPVGDVELTFEPEGWPEGAERQATAQEGVEVGRHCGTLFPDFWSGERNCLDRTLQQGRKA